MPATEIAFLLKLRDLLNPYECNSANFVRGHLMKYTGQRVIIPMEVIRDHQYLIQIGKDEGGMETVNYVRGIYDTIFKQPKSMFSTTFHWTLILRGVILSNGKNLPEVKMLDKMIRWPLTFKMEYDK
jgi:hypothetical protein